MKEGNADPKTTIVIETTESELTKNIGIHRRPMEVNVMITDESYVTSTNDLGALDMINRANSIFDAKEKVFSGMRPDSNNFIRLKSTEVHSRFSNNADKTRSANKAASDQFSIDDSLISKGVLSGSKAKQ